MVIYSQYLSKNLFFNEILSISRLKFTFTPRVNTMYNESKPILQTTNYGRMKNMKKIIKYITLIFVTGAFIFGLAQNKRTAIRTEAATVETKRVWLHTAYVTWWDGDLPSAKVGIHYWGGIGVTGTSWPGVDMAKDTANNLWYFDVPANTENIKFTRIKVSDPTGQPFNKSVDIELGTNVNSFRFELWNDEISGEQQGALVAFTPTTTTIVAAFAATIDTSEEVCTVGAAQAAVDAYNALSTFEQDQFDALQVGDGKTGLDRLNYLKARFNISTPLNARVTPEVERNVSVALMIGTLGLTSLIGYYFISKRDFHN